MVADDSLLKLVDLFGPAAAGAQASDVVASPRFRRQRVAHAAGTELLIDTFADHPGATCCSVRLASGGARNVRLQAGGVDEVVECAAGGWLLRGASIDPHAPSYWIPQLPACRTLDAQGRILSQRGAQLRGIGGTSPCLWIDIAVAPGTQLDFAVWRFDGASATDAMATLDAPLAIERQRWFLRSSHTVVRQLADLYQCLVHGWVYDNRFVWRRIWGGFRWRICSENEAHSLYMALNGLERATGRTLYTLLKRQVLLSIIARQSADGGWYHGEWTDLMESHLRLHSAGVLILESALEEASDPVVAKALEAAAAFLASHADRTALGLWFLHDGLELSTARATTTDAPPWTPTRMLGASASNKLILNTHLDAMVALDRYREISGDQRHAAAVESARATARSILGKRPAEGLYRLVYWLVWLTLLPPSRASQLSLPMKVLRRLARDHLNPALYRLKQRFPRLVMPGGLIDRHLSPKHFDMGYHTVNLMDVVRLTRRFPQDDYREIVRNAIDAVTETGLLQFWIESKHVQPLGYWIEALYHLCTLDDTEEYRAHLAHAILIAEGAGMGLPPALLGADPEAVGHDDQTACPSPRDQRLRVANLSGKGRREFLVVNAARDAIELDWDAPPGAGIRWTPASDQHTTAPNEVLTVPPRSWLRGRSD